MSAETFDANEHSRRYAAADILVALIAGPYPGDVTDLLSCDELADRALRLAERIFPVSIEEAEDPEPAAREEGAAAERARIRQMALDRADTAAGLISSSGGQSDQVIGELRMRVMAFRDFAALLEKP